MKKFAFASLAILALCAVADAGGHCVVRQRVIHHQAAVVVQPVAAAVYAPVVAVPAYSVGYSSANLYEENERLKLEIKVQRLELQIQRLQSAPLPQVAPQPQAQIAPSPPVPLPQAQVGEHPAVGIMRANCAACHEASVAKGKGGGFTLFQGQTLAKLSCEQTLAMIFAVHDGDMPKGARALADQDFGVLMQYLRANAKR